MLVLSTHKQNQNTSTDKRELVWKVNTGALFEEILHNDGMWIMERPLQLLHRKMLLIAQKANEAQNEEIMKLCCEIGLYEECDPTSKSYDKEKANSLINQEEK